MVAVRTRTTALAFAALMILSTVVIVAPTATASHTIASVQVAVFFESGRNNVPPATPAQDLTFPVRVGDTLRINATATGSGTSVGGSQVLCATGTFTPSFTAQLRPIDSAQPETTTITSDETGFPFWGEITIPVRAGSLHGAPVTVTVTARASCVVGTTPNDAQTANGVSAAFNIDNSLPVVTVASPTSGVFGIGQSAPFSFTASTGGATAYVLNVSNISSSATVPSTPIGTTTNVELTATGHDNAVVTGFVTDAAGNIGPIPAFSGVRFDTLRPSLTNADPIVAKPANGIQFTFLPGEVSVTDVARYELILTPVGGSALPPVVCPKAGDDDCVRIDGAAGTNPAYNVSASGLTANTVYNVVINAFDTAGNPAPSTISKSVTTAPNLAAVVEYSLAGAAPGKIDSLVNVRVPTPPAGAHVSRVVVETDEFGPTTDLVWGNGGAAFGSNLTFTVGNGLQEPKLVATAYGPTGDGAFPNPIGSTGHSGGTKPAIDAKAPSTPSNYRLTALPNGSVHVQFTPTTEADLKHHVLTYSATGIAARTANIPEFATDYYIARENLTLNVVYSFRLAAVDDVGNVGVEAVAPITPTETPIFGQFDQHLPAKVHYNVTGNFSAIPALTAENGWINVSMQRDSDDQYWNPTLNSGAGGWQTAEFFVRAGFTTGVTSGTWWTRAFESADAEPGTYTFTLRLKNSDTGLEYPPASTPAPSMTWLLDTTVPALATGTGKNDVIDRDPAMQDRPLRTNLAVTDAGGIANVTYTLHHTTTGNPQANDAFGAPLKILCPSEACPAAFGVGVTAFDATLGPRFTNVPFGSYKLKMVVNDTAGNSIEKTVPSGSSNVVVKPRVLIAENDGTPAIGPDGRLRLRAYAAWNGAEAFDNNGQSLGECPDRVCRVARIEFYTSTTGTGAISGTPAHTEYLPVAGHDSTVDSLVQYYNYTPPSIQIGNGVTHVAAKVVARTSPATTSNANVESVTPWIRIRTSTVLSGLSVIRPIADNGTFMPGTLLPGGTKTVNLSVALDTAGQTGTPDVRYSIFNESSGLYTFIHQDLPDMTPEQFSSANMVSLTRTNPTGVIAYYNWSANVDMDRGSYLLNVTATTNAGTQQVTRRFTVESGAMQIHPALTTVSDIYESRYVRNEFNFTMRVIHGFAGLNATSLKVSLVDTAGQTVAESLRVIETKLLERDASLPFGQTNYSVRVRLPANAADTARYDLRFNFTSEAVTTCMCNRFADTFSQTVVLDSGPGTSQIFASQTEQSGKLLSGTPKVFGQASDTGTGVSKVSIRVVNVTGSSTWRPAEQKFVAGIQDGDSYYITGTVATTGTTSTAGPLELVKKGRTGDTDVVEWTVTSTGASGVAFDRGSQYFIDVRVTDNAGFVSSWKNTTIKFDPDAPTLSGFAFTGGVATNTVNWHSTQGKFTVTAGDNACVGTVRLNAARSDGTYYASANFTRPTAAICGPSSGNTAQTWELDLVNHSNVTDFVGSNRYTVEAFDPAGNRVGLSQVIILTVRDTTPPKLNDLYFEPSTIGAGLPATVVADVFENAQIARIEIYVSPVDSPGTILGRGNMTIRNATSTGTGLWEARISGEANAQVNLSLARGDYLVSARAYDVNAEVTCPNDSCVFLREIMRVIEGAPPQIVAKAPTGVVVNATPNFRWEITDLDLAPTGVSVAAGFNGALTEVPRTALTFAEIRSTNNTVLGQTVSFTPPAALADGPNYTARVIVASTRTGFQASSDTNVTVDGTPPTVSSSVTGTQPLNNRTYAVGLTRVAINASDNSSATSIRYTVNGGNEQAYSGPITPSGDDGEWKLEFWARDAAGNNAPKQTVTLHLDRTGPRITVNSHGDNLVLTVNDDGVGVNDSTVTVYYRYGSATTFTPLTATRVAGGNTFRAALPGNANATGLAYYFTALDVLGNQGTFSNHSAVNPYRIEAKGDETPPPPPPPENTPPTLTITAPTSGQSVTGSIDIKWTAADEDGESLTVVVARQNPNTVIMPPATDPGHFVWNVTGLPAGAVTIVVTASDGTHEASQQVTFNIVPRQAIQARPIPQAPVLPGAGVPIEVSITPADTTVESATYSIKRNGTQVATGPLVRTASGTYVATISANQSGVYVVSVDVVYGNSTTESRAIGQFAVATAAPPPVTEDPARSFPASLMVLAALAVLTVALAAYGAFGRWRK